MIVTIDTARVQKEIYLIEYFDRFKCEKVTHVIYDKDELERKKLIIAKKDCYLLPEYSVFVMNLSLNPLDSSEEAL